jgi:hypothetical protein
VAVVRAEEPEIAVVIHLPDVHRPADGRSIADGGTEEAGLRLIDELPDLGDRVAAAEVVEIVFRLITVD